jgi:hypothetical protein
VNICQICIYKFIPFLFLRCQELSFGILDCGFRICGIATLYLSIIMINQLNRASLLNLGANNIRPDNHTFSTSHLLLSVPDSTVIHLAPAPSKSREVGHRLPSVIRRLFSVVCSLFSVFSILISLFQFFRLPHSDFRIPPLCQMLFSPEHDLPVALAAFN